MSFDALNGDCLSQIAASLHSSLELMRAAMVCHAMLLRCQAEAERRVRRILRFAWTGCPKPRQEPAAWIKCFEEIADGHCQAHAHDLLVNSINYDTHARPQERPYEATDLVALAAQYAGGWGALLAGREGTLDTRPLKNGAQRSAPGVPLAPVEGYDVETRHVDAVPSIIVIWELLMDGKRVWSGILPLFEHIDSSQIFPRL